MRILVLLNAEGRTIATAGPAREHERIVAACAATGLDATVKLVSGADLATTARRALEPGRGPG
jgi:hypothetical protein